MVDGEVYEWVLRDNSLHGKERHIAVYSASARGQPLYLDPYAWEFEVRPRTVSDAIKFALTAGWTPKTAGPPIYLGFRDNQFFRLPGGTRFAHQSREE